MGTMRKHLRLFSLAFLSGVLPIIILLGCVEKYETKTIDVTVVKKWYKGATIKTQEVKVDGEMIKQTTHTPEQYLVTLRYEKGKTVIENIFNDKALYNRVKKGQTLTVEYKTGLDAKGNTVTEEMVLLD